MKASYLSIIRYFSKPYKWLFGGIVLAAFLTSLLEGLNVAAFFPVFSSLLRDGEGLPHGGFLGAMVTAARRLPFQDAVVSAMMLLVGITLIKNCSMLLRDWLVAYASGTVQHNLRTRLVECYAASSYAVLLDSKQGKLIYHASIGASRVGILTQKITQLLAEVLRVAAIGALLLVTLPWATGALAIIALAYHWLTHHLSKRISYHTGTGRMIAGAEQTSIVNEFLNGIRQIITFGTHQAWLERFHYQSRVFRNLYIKDAVWLAAPKGLLELSVVLVLSGFVLASRLVSPSTLTENLPVLGVFAMALLKLLPSLTAVGQLRMEALSLMSDAEETYHMLVEFKPRPMGGNKIFSRMRKGIVFDRVSFAHKGRGELLKGVSVAFEKGKVTAIVGPSGSGKTTIVNLILGLFEPTDGRVLIDDLDLNEYRSDSWRRRIGFVAQDAFIYHASIAENITFGRTGFSRQSIQRAAEVSNAREFIERLPQGYDTVVGERGMKLSGGEQQRIAIARAVLDDPEILIFDEATSSLDAISEKLVQGAIENISRDRTVIIIAHRLSTIRYADKIVVLDEGRILEEGNHQELLNARGRYFHLVASGRE